MPYVVGNTRDLIGHRGKNTIKEENTAGNIAKVDTKY